MEPSCYIPGSSPAYTIIWGQTLPDNQCMRVVPQLWLKLVLLLNSSKVPDIGLLLPLNAIFAKIPLPFMHSPSTTEPEPTDYVHHFVTITYVHIFPNPKKTLPESSLFLYSLLAITLRSVQIQELLGLPSWEAAFLAKRVN